MQKLLRNAMFSYNTVFVYKEQSKLHFKQWIRLPRKVVQVPAVDFFSTLDWTSDLTLF